MKFVPCEKKNLKGYIPCKNQMLIREFVDSGLDCAKIEDYPHKNAYGCRSAMAMSIRRMGMDSTIGVTASLGDVYIYRKDM